MVALLYIIALLVFCSKLGSQQTQMIMSSDWEHLTQANSLWYLPNVKLYFKIIASHGNVKGLSLGWPKSSSDEFNSFLNMSMLTHNEGPHEALINCVACRPRIGPYPWSMYYNSLCPHFDVFLVATDLFLLMVHKFNRFPTILISFLKLIMTGNILKPSCGYIFKK